MVFLRLRTLPTDDYPFSVTQYVNARMLTAIYPSSEGQDGFTVTLAGEDSDKVNGVVYEGLAKLIDVLESEKLIRDVT